MRRHACLRPGGERMSLGDDFFCGVVEAVAVAVRTSGHSRRDDGVAPLADFVEGGILDDLLSPGGSIRPYARLPSLESKGGAG